MSQNRKTEFVRSAGGSIASKRILDGTSSLKWAFRDKSVDPADNGWRFFSADDDEDYINNADHLAICDFNTIAAIEPAIIAIYLFPVGSNLQLVIENGKRFFIDNNTGRKVD